MTTDWQEHSEGFRQRLKKYTLLSFKICFKYCIYIFRVTAFTAVAVLWRYIALNQSVNDQENITQS